MIPVGTSSSAATVTNTQGSTQKPRPALPDARNAPGAPRFKTLLAELVRPPAAGAGATAAGRGAGAETPPQPMPSLTAAHAEADPTGRAARAHADEPRPTERERAEPEAVDPADPWSHRSALLAPPLGAEPVAQAQAHTESVHRRASIEELAPLVLKKMAWSGDGKRGTARLELGAGPLAGAVLTLEADGKQVRLAIDGVSAREEAALRGKLGALLGQRGFSLES